MAKAARLHKRRDTLGSIENLVGSSFADGLRGSGAANVLNGHGGDDSLLGQGGGDTLDGGGGTDHLDGGGGTDRLTGSRGFGDVLDGGAGPDTLAYGEVLESSGRAFDTVVGFNATADVFDLPVAVGGIDPRIRSGRLDDASFNGDLARAANAAALLAQHAVQFTPDQGSHAGETFLLVDGNGVAGYQVHQDFVFHLQGPRYLSSLGTDRFV
jgi:Ca2+-binding RTX toxin-like protein